MLQKNDVIGQIHFLPLLIWLWLKKVSTSNATDPFANLACNNDVTKAIKCKQYNVAGK